MANAARTRFWSRTLRLTVAVLAAWLLLNLAGPWFARDLNVLNVAGFPLGYWLAAQGALILYLVIIVVYVVAMDRLEARCLQAEAGERDAQDDVPGTP